MKTTRENRDFFMVTGYWGCVGCFVVSRFSSQGTLTFVYILAHPGIIVKHPTHP
jgi:hypothetical protein